MIRIFILIIISSLFVQKINSQTFTKKELKNTKWFSDNRDSLFFKSNKLNLIKYNNVIKKEINATEYIESEYYSDVESIQLEFDRKCILRFDSKNYHVGSKSLKKWKLKDSILNILDKNNKPEYIFKIDSYKEIEFKLNNKVYKTYEMILMRR